MKGNMYEIYHKQLYAFDSQQKQLSFGYIHITNVKWPKISKFAICFQNTFLCGMQSFSDAFQKVAPLTPLWSKLNADTTWLFLNMS